MPEGLTLGFDTSAAHCAAALLGRDGVLAARHEEMGKGQAERLFPLLDEILAEAGAGWRDLGVIGVGVGPGNFTGIRIAVAAARGLSLSLGIPAIGVTSTEAAAHGLPRPCRVVLPAARGALIWQDFLNERAEPIGLSPDGALPPGPAPRDPCLPVAVAVARLADERRHGSWPRPAPLYLRPADAAPARDAGPVILDA